MHTEAEHAPTTPETRIEDQYILSYGMFALLSVLTLNLYLVWWQYKAWRFFQQYERQSYMPAVRAVFSLFFVYSLTNRMLTMAREKGYTANYSPEILLLLMVLLVIASQMPFPVTLLTLLMVFVFMPPFRAFRYALQHSGVCRVVDQHTFNTRQIVLIVIGGLFWLFIILGMIGMIIEGV